MFNDGEYSFCCDWFEGTCWPRVPADVFVWNLCDEVFGRSPDEIAVWSGRGWQGYSNRCTIGGNDKLITLYFRRNHCFEHLPAAVADDMTYGVAEVDGYGEFHGDFFDVHIVVTGSGLRFLGNDGAKRLMQFFAIDGFSVADNGCPRFAYDFSPTRIDIAFDVFTDNGFIDQLSDALLSEYNHGCLPEYKGVNRCSCNSKVRTLIGHMQEGSLNWTWGSRGTSNFYFRLYDKRLEQHTKNGPLKGRHEYWWRMEYECRFVAALNVARMLIYDMDVQEAVSYCVENYLCVVEDRYSNDAKAHNPIAEFWCDFVRFIHRNCGTYKRQYVVEPYTIIHLVQNKIKLMSKRESFFCYIANPFAFQDEQGQMYLQRLRNDPQYKTVMYYLDQGALTLEEYNSILSDDFTRGVSDYWTINL